MSTAAAHQAALPVDPKGAPPDPWIGSEPRLGGALLDIGARGLRRPYLVLGLSLALTAAVVGARLALRPGHTASLTFRMEEGGLIDAKAAPRPPARIREFITDVALSRDRVLELMERHHLSDPLRRANPAAAVKSFRQDLSVEVLRNYFLLDWDTSGQPRSAEVVISYSGGDREKVQGVVEELRQIILETLSERRAARLAEARALSAAEERRERQRLAALESRLAQLSGRPAGASRVESFQALSALTRDLGRSAGRSGQLGRRATSLDYVQAAERSDLGLTFRLVDERLLTTRPPLGPGGVARWALAALAVLAPLVTFLLGAFDQRIRRAADVAAFGFPLFGAVAARAGDDAGSLAARRAAGRRVR